MLASSTYNVQFAPASDLSERVLLPVTPSQSNGIEYAPFVLFHNDDSKCDLVRNDPAGTGTGGVGVVS